MTYLIKKHHVMNLVAHGDMSMAMKTVFDRNNLERSWGDKGRRQEQKHERNKRQKYNESLKANNFN